MSIQVIDSTASVQLSDYFDNAKTVGFRQFGFTTSVERLEQARDTEMFFERAGRLNGGFNNRPCLLMATGERGGHRVFIKLNNRQWAEITNATRAELTNIEFGFLSGRSNTDQAAANLGRAIGLMIHALLR